MAAWTSDELAKIGAADELQIASRRRDGTLASPRTEGHIRAGGVDKDVTFVDADLDLNDQIDAAYHRKHRRYAARIVDSIVSPAARSATVKLVPRPTIYSTNPQGGHACQRNRPPPRS